MENRPTPGREAPAEQREVFIQTLRGGKAVSSAREKGYELISEDRLGDVLADLAGEGYMGPLTDNEILVMAKRGMEILKG